MTKAVDYTFGVDPEEREKAGLDETDFPRIIALEQLCQDVGDPGHVIRASLAQLGQILHGLLPDLMDAKPMM